VRAVRRLVVLLVLAVVLAGCGGSSQMGTTGTTSGTASDPAAVAGGGTTIYRGGDWAVVVDGSKAVALHLTGDEWQPDRTGRVKIAFLGPSGVATPTPQVAAELKAPSRLVESGLWVDGVELVAKGGGLSPKHGTIYGAPSGSLSPGRHVAVAYARTAAAATAVARSFKVR
jgi:hypothetical protein